MYITPEQIHAANKANAESFFALANAQLAALEKLATLNAGALRRHFDDSIGNLRVFLALKGPEDVAALHGSFAAPALEKASAYWKSLYEIAADANAELSNAVERYVRASNESMIAAREAATAGTGAKSKKAA